MKTEQYKEGTLIKSLAIDIDRQGLITVLTLIEMICNGTGKKGYEEVAEALSHAIEKAADWNL